MEINVTTLALIALVALITLPLAGYLIGTLVQKRKTKEAEDQKPAKALKKAAIEELLKRKEQERGDLTQAEKAKRAQKALRAFESWDRSNE